MVNFDGDTHSQHANNALIYRKQYFNLFQCDNVDKFQTVHVIDKIGIKTYK